MTGRHGVAERGYVRRTACATCTEHMRLTNKNIQTDDNCCCKLIVRRFASSRHFFLAAVLWKEIMLVTHRRRQSNENTTKIISKRSTAHHCATTATAMLPRDAASPKFSLLYSVYSMQKPIPRAAVTFAFLARVELSGQR